MLITACTDCGARFRVTPDQLNLRQGAVKCGSCGHVFNGFETLEQIPDENFASYRDGVSDPGPQGLADAMQEAEARRLAEPVVEEMPEFASPAPVPLADIEDDLGDEVVEPVRPLDAEFEAEIERHAASRLEEETGQATPRTRAFAGAPTLPHELPEPAPRTPPGRWWGVGALLLFLSLAALALYEYRAALATRYPDLRPAMQAACEKLGCSVPWQNDELAVKLEDSELLEVPGQPGQITLATRIRNLSDHPQEFPLLQLTLTDIDGQASVRRVFAPADYLGRPLKPGDVMPARGDTLVSIRLEAKRVKPTGYELLLFYP